MNEPKELPDSKGLPKNVLMLLVVDKDRNEALAGLRAGATRRGVEITDVYVVRGTNYYGVIVGEVTTLFHIIGVKPRKSDMSTNSPETVK